MSGLPPGWECLELGQVATTKLGRMLSGRRETGRHAKPYLRNRDVQWGAINTANLPLMDFDDVDAARFRLETDDVLVCEGGEVGRAAVWSGQIAECYFQKALHRVRCSYALHPRYLRFLLEHYGHSNAFARFITGSTIAHLPQEDLRMLPVPLPPRPEQERIVAAIEEQFSRIDAGDAALQSAKQRLASLQKSILLRAIPGEPRPNWSIITVAEAGEVRLGRQRSPKFHHGPDMRPYLRVANVFEDRIDATDIMTMNFGVEEFEDYRLIPGDILLNEGQSPHLLGRPAMYRGEPPNIAFTNSLIRFRAGKDILPDWALLVFRRHLHAKRFMRESQITTNIAHLSAGRFKTVEFPVPALNEQRRIVVEVHHQLSLIAATKGALESELSRASALRYSLLAAAFSGKLVAQDANDEPASAVLVRIARERVNPNKGNLTSSHTTHRALRGSTA